MVVSTLLLDRQGMSIDGVCDDALHRIVGYAVGDLETGERSQAYSGEVQTYFDGTDELRSFDLAWLEAYLSAWPNPTLEELAERYRPFRHSKLGGDQALLWGAEN